MSDLERYLAALEHADYTNDLTRLTSELLSTILHNIHWRVTGPQRYHYEQALSFLKERGVLSPQAHEILRSQVEQLLQDVGVGDNTDYAYEHGSDFPHDYVGIGGTLI
jgi:hypothetical protein